MEKKFEGIGTHGFGYFFARYHRWSSLWISENGLRIRIPDWDVHFEKKGIKRIDLVGVKSWCRLELKHEKKIKSNYVIFESDFFSEIQDALQMLDFQMRSRTEHPKTFLTYTPEPTRRHEPAGAGQPDNPPVKL